MGFSANTILKKIEDSMPKDYLHKKKSLEKINSKINGRSLSVPKLEQSINASNMNNYYHFDEPRYGYRDISRTFRRTEESIEKTQDASKTGRVSEKESPRRATSKSFLSQKSLTSRKSHIELHEITPENRWKVTPRVEKSGRSDNQNGIVSAFCDVIEVKFGRGVKGIVRRTKSTPKLSMKLNKSSNIAVTSKEEENNKRKDSEKLTPKNIQSMRLPKFMTKGRILSHIKLEETLYS